MIVEPFKAEHLARLRLQSGQAWAKQFLTDEYGRALEQTFAFACFAGDRVVACAGVMDVWDGRGLLWSFIDESAGEHLLGLHRIAQAYLDATSYRRIEAEVDVEFKAAHRWMKLLGFELEAPRMRAHRPDGGDSALYARVK